MNKPTQQPQDNPDVPMAFVLLDRKVVLDGQKLEAAVRGSYPALKLQPMGGAAPSGTLLFKCDKMTVVMMAMDVPIPSGWEPIAERILPQWPEAVAVFSRHRAHLVVSVMGLQGTRLEAARMISAFAAAALASLPEASAVLWDGVVALSKPTFLEHAGDAFSAYPKIPHTMWVSLHPFRDAASGHIVVASFGLSKFVGREIEMRAPERKAKTLVERISGLITYLLQHGPVINDGDTIGVSQTERILVRLVASKHFDGVRDYFATLEAVQ